MPYIKSKSYAMKTIIYFFLLLSWCSVTAQVGINTDGSTPDASALLDLKSSDKGLLLPRLTSAQRDAITSPAEGLTVFCTDCGSEGSLSIYSNGSWKTFSPCSVNAPTAGTNTVTPGQVVWTWNSVAGATGYKWNTTNDYTTAIDMGTSLTKSETSLECETNYNRYVWAYNSCSFSTPVTLSQSTTACCGDFFTISHQASGGVAPVDKEVTYGTVNNIPGETSKCWITRNLGASQQATAVSDATEASSGWYWQFNRKQGYKHDGTNLTPATTWISSINESSSWTIANDPCAIELGTGWRIPTRSEWTNVDASGGWTNWNGPWGSNLMMHAAGYLSYFDGSLFYRGSGGLYWSSTQISNTEGRYLSFDFINCDMSYDKKAFGSSLRCIRE